VAGFAIHVFDVLGMRELGALSPAREFGVEGLWLGINHPLRVANHAIAIQLSFVIGAAGRMVDLAFGARGDGKGQCLLGRFVAEGPVHRFPLAAFVF
jgi:hypothetical protein